MNGLTSSLKELQALKAGLAAEPARAEVLVCPPFTLIAPAASLVEAGFALGGQDCHARPSGAHTGDIAAEMLKDAGASYVILGHSERRHDHGEQSRDVALKAKAAWRAGLRAIICIGETEGQRMSGNAHEICSSQIEESVPAEACPANSVIAYEPVWAIGTGKTPSGEDIARTHSHIRACLTRRLGPDAAGIRILYGGSVKPDNASEILNLPEVNGALVGGASLKAQDFLAIIRAV